MTRYGNTKPTAVRHKGRDGMLHTWQEIADYAGSTVRSVQRWEEFYHFPVHHRDSRVFASSDEIDAWVQQPLAFRIPATFSSNRRWNEDLRKDTADLMKKSRNLRKLSSRARAERSERKHRA